MIASRNNTGEARENGAVESHHRHLKTALDQAPTPLRGQRDFAGLAEYRAVVDQLVARRNRRHETAVRVEMAALRPLPTRHATEVTEIVACVTRDLWPLGPRRPLRRSRVSHRPPLARPRS